jgi:hypothetical protein
VPSYQGASTYLLLTKYNNYAGFVNGDGQNKVAVLDPNATEVEQYSGVTTMAEVLTVLGPTPIPGSGVHEWCINSAAVDPLNKCAVVNSEDGNVYRWNFSDNSLSPPLSLAPPTGEAYTSTVIGPDGAVYATNNATLFCCVAAAAQSGGPVGPVGPAATARPAVPRGAVLNTTRRAGKE